MKKPHRIAAGGIILKENSILLVRYGTGSDSYLVGPGGALEDSENVEQAIVRETMEETGITVRPLKVLWIEDLDCSRYKMSKTWMLCEVINGAPTRTAGAKIEGITDVRWFRKDELSNELVFPPPIKKTDWDDLKSDAWQTACLPSRVTSF
jgi:8-oxo-dGTP pyrophosphatase MutT (NUDIX family)